MSATPDQCPESEDGEHCSCIDAGECCHCGFTYTDEDDE